MIVYILVAIGTTIFAWASTKASSRVLQAIFLCMILFTFGLVAALRDISVGTDTGYYGYLTFEQAIYYPFLTFISPQVYSSWGMLYKAVAWLVSNVFGSFQALLFAIELCATAPVVFAGRKLAGKSFPLLIALYAVYFYPLSFNLIKQSIAIGFLLPAYYELERNKIGFFFFWILVACLFHSSAAFGLLLFPFYMVTKAGKMSLGAKSALVLAFSSAVVFAVPFLLNLFAHYLSHYSAYLDGGSQTISGHGYRNTVEMLTGFLAVILLWAMFKIKNSDPTDSLMSRRIGATALLVAFSVIVTSLSTYSISMGRIGLYFFLFFVLFVPTCKESIPGNKERLFFSTFAVLTLALISIDTYAITGQGEVVPYVFKGL